MFGPVLFDSFALPFGFVTRRHGIKCHCCADDTELYVNASPDDTGTHDALVEDMLDF